MSERNFWILVVDDSQESREICQRVLRREGYGVQTVDNGEKALDELYATRFDLVITDLKMPELDGMSFIRRAKEIDPKICVIVITGYPSEESKARAIELGASGYLAKPLDISELIAAVKGCLEHR
jgi:DNA-binding response OmpR family regulator